ncbi:MAG: S49 family peptidase [Anaerolineales bacterium]|jgi:protease-4|nr:S49 family peptidase [Anaerolineales bacterium]
MRETTSLLWQKISSFVGWALLPLAAGILIAALMPRPVVGLIYLNEEIQPYSAESMIRQIEYARQHPEVRAVVLVMDSPGGTVADTESIYLELLKLRQTKPVVASVNQMAASGAYYLAVGTDYIITRPTSSVGNVGVIGYLPSAPGIYEYMISTGPYKLFGYPRDHYIRQIEMVKQGFALAIEAGRGDRLKVEMETVLTGQLWLGSEALGMGIIDQLGNQSDAEEKAAELARVRNYTTLDLSTVSGYQPPEFIFYGQAPSGETLQSPAEPGIYLLHIPSLPLSGH